MRTLFTLFLSIPFLALAQFEYLRNESVVVYDSQGDTLYNAWAGGLNSPQLSQIDLDFDGIKDLFIFDRDGGNVKTFLNKGTANEVSYIHAPEYQDQFPVEYGVCLLVDYNGDGKEDIFTTTTAGLTVWRNDGDIANGLVWTNVMALIHSQYNPPDSLNLYVASTDLPAIVDVDEDGDLDILSFGVSGSQVYFHENMSMDLYGDLNHLQFVVNDACWGKFMENALDNSVQLNVLCKGVTPPAPDELVHSGSTLLAIDLDGDQDKELMLGDVSFRNMVQLTNGGTLSAAIMVSQDSMFPNYDVSVDVEIFPAGFYLDVDNDNVKDLIVAPNAVNASVNTESVWFYHNNGTDDTPILELQTTSLMQNDMIEVGTGCYPDFLDYNANGLMDMVVGNYGVFDGTGSYNSTLYLYANIGSPTQPAFKLISEDYLSLSTIFPTKTGLHPSFGDLDADGDIDLIIGDSDGKLQYFENDAGVGNPPSYTLVGPDFKGIDVGQYADPQLIDVNRDGKLDLIIGERSGNINYFINTGTPSSASFSNTPDNSFFGGIDVMIPCCTGYCTPFMTEDAAGEYVLYVGSERGVILMYEDIEVDLNGAFTLVDSLETFSDRITMAGYDLTGDGIVELVYGENAGGMAMLFRSDILLLFSPADLSNDVNTNVFIDWSAVTGITKYHYQVDTIEQFNSPWLVDGENLYGGPTSGNSDTEYELTNLEESTTYYWRVRTITFGAPNDTSDWSDTWEFLTEWPDGMEEQLHLDKNVRIFPNPTNNTAWITFNNDGAEWSLIVFDVQGRVIESNQTTEPRILVDLQSVASGMYVVQVQSNNAVTRKKLIKK